MSAGSDFLAKLGITYPLIQAPMAGVSTPAMAAAVSEAGGLGSLSIGAVGVDEARRLIAEVRALTEKPFLINVFCHTSPARDAVLEAAWIERLRPAFAVLGAEAPAMLKPVYESFMTDVPMLEMLLEARPAAVSFHFGLPAGEVIRALKDAGIFLMATATCVEEALAIEAAGVDSVVAQGWEAGGHRGVFDPMAPDERLGTLALVKRLVGRTTLPVVAAGGLMDGADIAAVLELGAVAAQLGTAFVGCEESAIDEGYRAALAEGRETVMTAVISGRPARCLVNKFTVLGEAVEVGDIPAYPVAYDAGKALHAAGKVRGEFGYGAQWAGRGVGRVRVMGAGDLVGVLMGEMEGVKL